MTLRNYLTKVRDMAQGEVRQADVERVRASNRLVAERIGAMSDGFLGRARLGLDSGYTSRVLRSLEHRERKEALSHRHQRVRAHSRPPRCMGGALQSCSLHIARQAAHKSR